MFNKKIILFFVFSVLVMGSLFFFRSGEVHDSRMKEITDKKEKKGANFIREYFERWNYPYGAQIPAVIMTRMQNELKKMPDEHILDEPFNEWISIGPNGMVNSGNGHYSGRILSIYPDSSGNLTAGASNGGVWSISGGTYTALGDDLNSLVASVVIRPYPLNPDALLIGTGEARIRTGTGLWFSTNNGGNWQKVSITPEPGVFYKIIKTPDNRFFAATDAGIYKGLSAVGTWSGQLMGNACDVAVNPVNPDTLYTAFWGFGVWWTTNSGGTWTQLTNGLPTQNIGRISLSVSASTPNVVFACYATDTNTTLGIFKSTDYGQNWNSVYSGNFLGNQGWYNNVISVSPVNPAIVLAGGVSLLRSTDEGINWTALSDDGDLHADQHFITWSTDGGKVWVGNDGGISYSTNAGLTWSTPYNLMPITEYVRVAAGRSNSSIIAGGSQDNGISMTTNGGENWTQILGGDGGGVSIDPFSSNISYVTCGAFDTMWAFRRYRTSDYGATWAELNDGVDFAGTWYNSIRNDSKTPFPNIYNNSGKFVYKSTNNGTNWFKLNTTEFVCDEVSNVIVTKHVFPHAIVYAALWTGVPGAHRLKVLDANVWYERSTGFPAGQNVHKISVHPVNTSIAYAVMNGIGTPGQKIYKTTNKGVNWTNISGDIPDIPLSDLVAHPTISNNLYLGSQFGCFRTTNGGVNWVRWNNGIPGAAIISELDFIDSLAVNGKFYILAGTYGRSMYIREISGEDLVPITYQSSEAFQSNTRPVVPTALSQDVIGIRVIAADGNFISDTLGELAFYYNGTVNTDVVSPAVYYTGNSGEFSTSQLFGFSTNFPPPPGSYFTVTNANGVTLLPDTNYFWLAYDIPSWAAPGNLVDSYLQYVKINGVSKSPSVNNPSGSRLIRTSLCGTKTVGVTLGLDYPSLKDAFDDIALVGLKCDLVLNIVTSINEPSQADLLEWHEYYGSGYTLTIQPADNSTMKYVNGSVKISGADRVMIKGINNSELKNRNNFQSENRTLFPDNRKISNSNDFIADGKLTFSGNSSQPALEITENSSNGARYNLIQDCIIEGANSDYNSGVLVISGDGYASPTSYNIVTDCAIRSTFKPANCIMLRGGNNTTIRRCDISDFNENGIVATSVNNVNIEENNIYQNSPGDYGEVNGIKISAETKNTYVFKNKIHDISSSSPFFKSITGIYCGVQATPSYVSVHNNMVYLNATVTTPDAVLYGINIPSSYYNSTDVMYNSVYIGGSGVTSGESFAFNWNAPSSGSSVRVFNNIFVNVRSNSTGSSNHYALNIGLFSPSAEYQFDYNCYYASGNGGMLGKYNFTNINSFDSWKTTVNKDWNSINTDPHYVSPVNLHIDTTSWAVNNLGIPRAGIGTDIDGNTRSVLIVNGPTDMGADEYNAYGIPPSAVQIGSILPGNNTQFSVSNKPIASIQWGGSLNTDNPLSLPDSVKVLYYPGYEPPNSPASSGRGLAYWDIIAYGGNGYSYNITLKYDSSILGNLSSENIIRIAKRDGGDWMHYANSVVVTDSDKVYMNGLDSFSQFALSDNGNPLPVQISSFTSSVNNRDVRLSWITESEYNNAGFEVQRKIQSSNEWKKLGSLPGAGTSSSAHVYNYIDQKLGTGKYNYRLKQLDFNGHFEYYYLVDTVEIGKPKNFSISQNYPNPFNPLTKIDYDVPSDDKVTIKIYDILGREVFTLVNNEFKIAGYYTAEFNASNLASGVYFYRLNAGRISQVKKMIVVK